MLQHLTPLFDYSDDLQAEQDAESIEAHGIPCIVRHEHETFNPAFTLKASLNAVHLLVPEEAVDEARDVLATNAGRSIDSSLETVLAGWPDSELIEIAARPDEWHPATVGAAERGLDGAGCCSRGRPVTRTTPAAWPRCVGRRAAMPAGWPLASCWRWLAGSAGS